MSGKRYPEEFKIEAVKQVLDRGHSVSSVATRLDICSGTLNLAT
jgi:transposase